MTRIANLATTTTLSPNDVLIVSDGSLTRTISVSNFKSNLLNKASKSQPGIVRVGAGLDVSESGVISVHNYSAYTLPVSSEQTLGGVKPGRGVVVDIDGTIHATYSLPTASSTVIGGVMVGTGLTIDASGVLSVDSMLRNVFQQGIEIGSDQKITVSVNGRLPQIREFNRGEIDISVVDSSIAGGFAGVRVISSEVSHSLSGNSTPSLVPSTSQIPVNLGITSQPWNAVYAINVYADVTGKLFGNSTGTHSGNLLANDSSLAYNAATKTFAGTFQGTLSGNAETASKLAAPRKINGVLFDGTENITVEDSTKLQLTGGAISGELILRSEPTLGSHATTKKYVDDLVYAKVSLTGGVMQGFLTLSDAPQDALHAATKDYVDGLIATKLSLSGGKLTGPLILSDNPTLEAEAATKNYADNIADVKIRDNNVALRAYIDERDSTKVSIFGSTMTGPLTLHGAPVADNDAATKVFVEDTSLALQRYTDSRIEYMQSSLREENIQSESKLHASIKSLSVRKLETTGGTVTGHLSLPTLPVTNSHAANKVYVDTEVATAHEHIVNVESSIRSYVKSTYLPKAGGKLTGLVELSADPSLALHAATKQYVDAADVRLTKYVDSTYLPKAGGKTTGFIWLHSDPTNNSHAATKQYVDSAVAESAGMPIGAVVFFAQSTPPLGWVVADGSSLLTSRYPHLFKAIGYHYGGSGPEFKLPDLRGEFIRGWDGTRGVDDNRPFGSWQRGSLVVHNDDSDGFTGGIWNDMFDRTQYKNTGYDTVTQSQLNSWISGTTLSYPVHGGKYANWGAQSTLSNTAYKWTYMTRPRNVAMLPCIKAYGSIDAPNQILAKGVVDQVNALPSFAYIKFRSDGTIVSRKNTVDVVRTADGHYTITLAPGYFSESPVVTANCGEDHVMTIVSATTTEIKLTSHDPASGNNQYSDPSGIIHVIILA